jgi:hypothetical protein
MYQEYGENIMKDPAIRNAFRMAIGLIGIILLLLLIGYFVKPLISFGFNITATNKTLTNVSITTDSPIISETSTLPPPTRSDITATATPAPIATIFSSSTATFGSTDTKSPTSTKTPFVPLEVTAGTNLPVRFSVDGWRNNYRECDRKQFAVIIYGVFISHGVAPYEFIFRQFDNVFTPLPKPPTIIDDFKEYVEFEKPFAVLKGKYTRVEITFGLPDNSKAKWIDGLYFRYPDNRCP